jgi:pyridoxine kinase
VHGYVGNKSAVFPLQLLGFDVDPLHSVQLSNHTAYSAFKGQVLTGEDMSKIVDGLRTNGLLSYSHILTGYVSSASFLRCIVSTVASIRAVNPSAVYVCDPVMGDHGKLYVPADLVPIYRCVSPVTT